MIPEYPDSEPMTFTPRLATSADYRLRFKISALDRERFDALDRGEVCEITELEHGTRWQARKAPCALTEPGVPSCYCDAVALPAEHSEGLASIPVEVEAPLPEQLRAVQAILDSPGLHPAHRLGFEEAARQLEGQLERIEAATEIRASLHRIGWMLDDRNLTATERELLELEAAQLIETLVEVEDGIYDTDPGCYDPLHEPGSELTVTSLAGIARVAANAARNGDPGGALADAALAQLTEAVEDSCSDCIAAALRQLATSTE